MVWRFWAAFHPVVFRKWIAPESTYFQCIGMSATGSILIVLRFSDGQTASVNMVTLMAVALAGWINQQQQDAIRACLKQMDGVRRGLCSWNLMIQPTHGNRPSVSAPARELP